METKTIDRTKEKMELARELSLGGYTQWVNENAKCLEIGLHFKETNRNDIDSTIIRNLWKHPEGRKIMLLSLIEPSLAGLGAGSVVGFGIGTIVATALLHSSPQLPELITITGFSILGLSLLLGLVLGVYGINISIESDFLHNWKGNLPYGALLAVKEAREKELYSFDIWYPTRAKSIDPVITAKAGDRLFKIFEWDEGKLYD